MILIQGHKDLEAPFNLPPQGIHGMGRVSLLALSVSLILVLSVDLCLSSREQA